MYTYIYIYIYIGLVILLYYIIVILYNLPLGSASRSAERPACSGASLYYINDTVGFHNFNLRILNLRVSNPNKLILDVSFDTMSDFNVPGSRPPKKR